MSSSSSDDSSNTLVYLGSGILVLGLIGAIFMYVKGSKDEDDERTVSVSDD